MRPIPTQGPSPALGPRLLLSLASVLLVLLVFEIGFRVKAHRDDRELDELGRLGRDPVIHDPTREVRTKNIIRLSPNPRIIYELIPGLQGRYKGAIVSINSDGFRGPSVARERTRPALRIAGLGDSVMFGYGVGDQEFYLHYLRERLAAAHPEVEWEFINGAVPGYNTAMQVETLTEKLLAYDPDLVLIDYVDNDLDLPNFIRNRSPYFSLRRSYLWNSLAAFRKGWDRTPDDRLARPPEEVPAAYADMVGIEAYRRSLRELARIGRERDLPVLVLCHLRFPARIAAAIDEVGLPRVEAYPALEAHLGSLGQSMQSYPGSVLTVSEDDVHPSPTGHRLIAGVLYDHLEKSGVLRPALARRRATLH